MQIHELPGIAGSSADDGYTVAIDSGEATFSITPTNLAEVIVSASASTISQADIDALFD